MLQHEAVQLDQPACTVTATLGAAEVSFSLRTRDPHVAKARTGIAETHFQRLFNSLRDGPSRLTRKQVVTVSGDWYRGFVATLEDDPGEALVLKQLQEACATPDLGEPDGCLSVFWKIEPPRVCRRLFRVSHAARFCSSSRAASSVRRMLAPGEIPK
ncbi:DUF6538 domain-containing protein [Xanthobacter sp. ZOL 2024]